MDVYSSAEDVINYTGVEPGDFDLVDDVNNGDTAQEKLNDLINGWLEGVTDIINRDRNRDFHQEVADGDLTEVPPGIHSIAMRMAANLAGLAVLRRETPITRHDDFTSMLASDEILTPALRAELSLYPKKREFGMKVVGADG